MHDIIIVGAGTAGLSAAIYGVRAGKRVLVFESFSYGGQIINSPEVENYPGIKKTSGAEFAMTLYEQATELGAEITIEKVTGIFNDNKEHGIITDNKRYPCGTIILATGAKNRLLGLPREKELTGLGIAYCATCDGAFYKGKSVAIVGGGNTALEDATFLAQYCSKVYVIHRRDTFRGEQKLLGLLKEKANVEFIINTEVTKLLGETRLESLEIINRKTNNQEQLKVEGLFIAIGQEPDNKDFSNLVNLDQSGYIIAGEDCKTNIPWIFVAGDCRTKKVRQLATAAADGAVAALAACEFSL